jgi:hypothetical protein
VVEDVRGLFFLGGATIFAGIRKFVITSRKKHTRSTMISEGGTEKEVDLDVCKVRP